VFDNLDRALSQSYIAKFDASGMARHIGIEKILVDIVGAAGAADDDSSAFTQSCILFRRAEDCWVRNVTTQHFVHAGVQFGDGSTRSTAQDCRAIDPRGKVTGGNQYNFGVAEAQLILFVNCHASGARHSFVSNGCSLDSGIVILDCTGEKAMDTAEGHRRWPQALLFDNLRLTNPGNSTAAKRAIGLYNRGNWGTAHGWGAVHSVAWNCEVPAGSRIVIQRPPGAQNYAIGCIGEVTAEGPFKAPVGYIEGDNKPGLEPRSLYYAQLKQRTGKTAVSSATGQTGTSIENAIVIKAKSRDEGIRLEHEWIKKLYPDSTPLDQKPIELPNGDAIVSFAHKITLKDNTVYSIHNISLPDGSAKTIYFDITDFYYR